MRRSDGIASAKLIAVDGRDAGTVCTFVGVVGVDDAGWVCRPVLGTFETAAAVREVAGSWGSWEGGGEGSACTLCASASSRSRSR
jgi:hypothetical protein